jgi:hypothetical protein
MSINRLIFGDIIDLSIVDIKAKTDYPNNQNKWRKNKIAVCLDIQNNIFFLINSKSYGAFAAHETIEIKKEQLKRLKKKSYLNLYSYVKAGADDFNSSSLSTIYRMEEENIYKTIIVKIENSSTLPYEIIKGILKCYKAYQESKQ